MTIPRRLPRPRPKPVYRIHFPDARPTELAPFFPSYRRTDWNYKRTNLQWPDVKGHFYRRNMEWSDELVPHVVWKLKWTYRISRLFFLHEKQNYIEPMPNRYPLSQRL